MHENVVSVVFLLLPCSAIMLEVSRVIGGILEIALDA